MGFVKNGQVVEIKVETFPFTLYGTIPGKVLSVSDDAAPIEKVGLVYPTESAWIGRRSRWKESR